ncbi:unnamed protein product [Euphydryas editha]|uniref:Reverse transcriptase domain-containing protein n=1 Tax=Euphydryas editha TaxID=104508 RepID=A0AAU9UGP3_EUPED|nr:unnamed protein product [Euphydryas editha]
MDSKISIFYQNARGLRTKTSCFKRNVLLNNYDIISITETWLLGSIHDEELFDDRYTVWRRDRDYSLTNQSLGGGVLLGIRRDFAMVGRPEWHTTSEDLWVTIIPYTISRSSVRIHICTIYLCKQNMGNTSSVQLENFSNNLSDIINSCPNDEFIIMGDFNLPHIDWDPQGNYFTLSGISLSGAQINFVDTLAQCDLIQRSQVRNNNNRFLDLVFSNCELDISPCDDPLVPDDIPHHKSLCIRLSHCLESSLKSKKRLKYFYKSGDFNSISTSLNDINWTETLHNKSLDDAVKYFYDTIYDFRNTYVPHKFIQPNSYPPWYSLALIRILKEKHKFFRKFKIYGNQSDYMTFSLLRKRAKTLENSCYESYINKTEDSIITNPRAFWSFTKYNSKKSSSFPSSMSYNSETASTGDKICDLFSNYFQANFLESSPNSNFTYPVTQKMNNYNIGDIYIDNDELLRLLESVNLNKGAGPDDIPPLIILKCAKSFVTPLSILFRRSLDEGYVPNIWKSAFITPIYKNGDKTNIKNYRPISKLCIFAKIFENIVYRQVYATIQSWFIPEQHGFLKGRSTTSNLLLTYDYVSSSMDSGAQVDIIYTDFSKAFDRIDHCILLRKIYMAGIHGNLFRWFSSYINNRSQAVALNGYVSAWVSVPSGVPQGSLLGPLLFAIFLNDISSCFHHSLCLLYADDAKIIKSISSIDDCRLLQEDLNRFNNYCQINKLDLNVSKCHIMNFTRKLNTLRYNYTLKNQTMLHINKIKDLV